MRSKRFRQSYTHRVMCTNYCVLSKTIYIRFNKQQKTSFFKKKKCYAFFKCHTKGADPFLMPSLMAPIVQRLSCRRIQLEDVLKTTRFRQPSGYCFGN